MFRDRSYAVIDGWPFLRARHHAEAGAGGPRDQTGAFPHL